MNKLLRSSVIVVMSFLILSSYIEPASGKDFAPVKNGFITPPDTIQTSVYWYWINDNISKEAVVKDLQSMKKVGINRAFIGNIGDQANAYGNIKLFSDEWWEVMHTALKTATELGIEIGIFNGPGWSQSGGPWIKTEQSMRYLASSELQVKGPRKLTQKLEQPTDEFEDVKVLAWPVSPGYRQNLLDIPSAKIKISDNVVAPLVLNNSARFAFANSEEYIDVVLPQKSIARSLVIYPKGNIHAECELQIKDGDKFHTIRKFNINRTNPALNVGFMPFAPIAISLPEVSSFEFRIVFNKMNKDVEISDIILSPTPIVERYAEKTLAKMFQSPLPYWDEYLWEPQPLIYDPAGLVKPEQIQDISSYMSADGTLIWSVPKGDWIIMRTGMAPTGVVNAPASPEGEGREIDKMSKEHVASHFDAFMGEIIKRIPAADRKSWKVVVQDSYETGGQNFTDDFLKEFEQRYGYDPLPYLPVFKGYTIGSQDLSDRFLWDLRRLIADKVSYDYVGGLRKISHQHGLTTWLENYGHWGFPGEFLQYGGQSDEIGGEFWSEGDLGDIENRAASSSAHIYGKSKVSAESFTCANNVFSRYPATMKKRGDWSFTEGINNTLLHVYIQQAHEDKDPGMNAWFGNEFNRKNTWFNHMDLFVNYLKRSNFMLQQGLNVADVAYYIGDDAPKMTGIRDPELPKGYSFDYINGEVILRDLQVKEGRLVLPHGTSYRILVLPKLETMRPEILSKIEQLVANGATVLGPPPSYSPSMERYPKADQEIKQMASNMWGSIAVKQRRYGKGTILTDMSMTEALDILKVAPDCRFNDSDPVLYNHRTVDGNEIYFITNQSEERIQINPKFRVDGMQPELWDAVNGTTRLLPAFSSVKGITTVPIQLEPLESAFIVFQQKGEPTASTIEANYPHPQLVETINSPWKVQFESDKVRRGPAETITFNKLTDWSQHDDQRIRYYSGTGIYTTSFNLKEKPKDELYLDLGKVSVMAKVKVNGQYVGGVWTAPYRLNISKFTKKGNNTLEIEVASTWVNRLIGDLRLPEAERNTWLEVNTWKADSPLQSSGLIGPVRLVNIK
ncbi:glycosyl hydrolase [Dysgonomonas sp. ZJ709]|uniref:glycosyl hydrolase n=1 Tax=Dysgonomonas sp. ZJ709 TaxID=2709797 RepID=UPI0013EB72DB|nr:glycosyl hydrolase [Dysgonomonas sp. ZJ709]